MAQVGGHIVKHFQPYDKLCYGALVDKVGCRGGKDLSGKRGRVSCRNAQEAQHKATVEK